MAGDNIIARLALGPRETHCAACGTELAETGPPINESYCPKDGCTRDRDMMRSAMVKMLAAERKRERLRDAAPELLAKLSEVLDFYDSLPAPHAPGEAELLDSITVLIAKARGAA